TSNGQKPVDMFLANLKTVDMFLEAKVRTGRIVDMFLTAILRTGTKNDYLFHFLVPRRDGSIADKKYISRAAEALKSRDSHYATCKLKVNMDHRARESATGIQKQVGLHNTDYQRKNTGNPTGNPVCKVLVYFVKLYGIMSEKAHRQPMESFGFR
ncbi:MAG: hypothetical protein Q4D34_07830, partial [Eggerthellaceae bacterium]|nr:hypothetical protein [Eggerthellaceae bacterium]